MAVTKYGFWGLLLFFCLHAQVALASGSPQFSVVIRPANPKVLPFEPLALSITVTNVSGAAASLMCCEIEIQMLNGAGKWIIYYSDATPIASVLQGKRAFQPGESITLVTYVDINHGGKHAFAAPGDVRLKVGVGELEDQVVTVLVEEPSGQDKAMLEALRSSGLTNYLGVDAPGRYEITQEKLRALTDFKAKFSGSRYADQVAVALGTYYIDGVNGRPDLPQAKRIFHELEAKSNTAPTAAYYLGVIAMQEGDLSAAQQYVESARNSSSNPLIQQRAKDRLTEIARKYRK